VLPDDTKYSLKFHNTPLTRLVDDMPKHISFPARALIFKICYFKGYISELAFGKFDGFCRIKDQILETAVLN